MNKLKVNAAFVDMTKVREEVLAAYGEIRINAAVILITDKGRELLSRHQVKMNVTAIIDVPENCKAKMLNGNITITGDMGTEDNAVLIANGNILLLKDCEEALRSYAKVMFNGNVLYPDSLKNALSDAIINGNQSIYPADATLIQNDLTIDRRFIRRANPGTVYYITGAVLMIDEDLDAGELIRKDITLMTDSAVLREPYEEVSDLIESDRVKIVPEGYAYLRGNVTMDETLSIRHGKKLYIDGNLDIPQSASALATDFEEIIVEGDVRVRAEYRMEWLKVVRRFAALKTYRGELLCDMPNLTVAKSVLEASPEGITIEDCVNVHFDSAITPELMEEKLLALNSCINVQCTQEQMGVVGRIAKDCQNIMIPAEDEQEEEDMEWSNINAASYTF